MSEATLTNNAVIDGRVATELTPAEEAEIGRLNAIGLQNPGVEALIEIEVSLMRVHLPRSDRGERRGEERDDQVVLSIIIGVVVNQPAIEFIDRHIRIYKLDQRKIRIIREWKVVDRVCVARIGLVRLTERIVVIAARLQIESTGPRVAHDIPEVGIAHAQGVVRAELIIDSRGNHGSPEFGDGCVGKGGDS